MYVIIRSVNTKALYVEETEYMFIYMTLYVILRGMLSQTVDQSVITLSNNQYW